MTLNVTPSVTLDGKVAVVTGSGRGLGLAYAAELARRGAAVVVNEPVRRLNERLGYRPRLIWLDLAVPLQL
jgi:NAD(P)-dependent dehydrogenase (short-subunit alcohol dehydrogenase family)